MFIAVSYSTSDPDVIIDIEFIFTQLFMLDYLLRLYISQDSLRFFFSGVAFLDFITVIPAVVSWMMTGFGHFETDVAVILQCVRVMRVFRVFRIIRVIRGLSLTASHAFQRQVFVLVLTVLSLIFAAAGMFQILESTPSSEYAFHKAVYYAAITVIGRPGVPFSTASTAIFVTLLGLTAATVIPTFVAELIRLWYDAASLDSYTPDAESAHVIICGDTNAARLRNLVAQFTHPTRDPNDISPVVILSEAKPEGALRMLIEEHKGTGAVRHVRGAGRRAGDLLRAGAASARAVVVLNYRSDKDATAADTEVLSTVMAVKNVRPSLRIVAQLQRPRRRNALRLVPGWREGDKAVASIALGHTLLGLGAHLPGLATLVTNLVRRARADGGAGGSGVEGKRSGLALVSDVAVRAWNLLMWGEGGGAPLPPKMKQQMGVRM